MVMMVVMVRVGGEVRRKAKKGKIRGRTVRELLKAISVLGLRGNGLDGYVG